VARLYGQGDGGDGRGRDAACSAAGQLFSDGGLDAEREWLTNLADNLR
jgi:hypothetical protein